MLDGLLRVVVLECHRYQVGESVQLARHFERLGGIGTARGEHGWPAAEQLVYHFDARRRSDGTGNLLDFFDDASAVSRRRYRLAGVAWECKFPCRLVLAESVVKRL